MATHPMTNNIPENLQLLFLASAAHLFALSTLELAETGGIPPEEHQKAGEEAIVLARKAMEIEVQRTGTESRQAANAMGALGRVLVYFNDVNDEEAIGLYERATTIFSRVYGSTSANVAAGEGNLGAAYGNRANKALSANDLDRALVNLGLALSHYRESARIYTAVNYMDEADRHAQTIAQIEENTNAAREALANPHRRITF